MYPLTPDSWTDPINQNLYAALVFLIGQALLLGTWKLLKWIWRAKPASKLVAVFGWLGLLVPPFAFLGLMLVQPASSPALVAITALSMMPAAVTAAQAHLALDRFLAVGVNDAIVNPDIRAYTRFLHAASSAFAFQGVGAEKLTRDFDAFQSMVSRCGTPANPVRLLLVSPEASWLKDGASRRGLGKSSFLDKQAQSLLRVARIRTEF